MHDTPLSEWDLIRHLTKGSAPHTPGLLTGIGDDCAVIEGDEKVDVLISTDAFLEDVHFRRSTTDFATLGGKALAASVSDIAAMGGKGHFYTMSLGLPASIKLAEVDALRAGLREVERVTALHLIGGDTCRSRQGISISMMVIGSVPKGRAILRSSATPGDGIYISGPLGNAALGLALLERGIEKGGAAHFRKHHRFPDAKLQLGWWLRETGMVNSMIDVSDGLLADLGHIADASGVGFELQQHTIPVDRGFFEFAEELRLSAVELQLTGGEDYELCFTVRHDACEDFEKLSSGTHRIGTIVNDPHRRSVKDAQGEEILLPRIGWDHFSPHH